MSDLPEIQDTVLDAATLGQLVTDLQAHAVVHDVMVKHHPQQRASFQGIGVAQAVDLLLTGQVRAAQLRYTFEGQEWRDTLMAVPGGVRIVRMAIPSG